MRTWDPFTEFEARLRDLEAMRRDTERGNGPRRAPQVAFLPGRAARAYPLVNMWEDADGFTIEALAPGVDPDSIQITVVRNLLTVSGEKRPPVDVSREAYHRSERAAGRFVRNIELPTEVESDRVEASYKNGLLVIKLPKAESAKPKQIKVSVG